jgi:hypothetical protein
MEHDSADVVRRTRARAELTAREQHALTKAALEKVARWKIILAGAMANLAVLGLLIWELLSD